GGSYLGARAAIEFVKGANYNALNKNGPAVYFSGNSIDPDALSELLEICADKDVCVNVISKSGTTTEPAIAFRVFRELLEKKYGAEGAVKRIFVTTDKTPKPGTLKEFADAVGYETFVVPSNIGGRFSVLSAVGLLPIAVAGCDIDAMMAGANDAMKDFADYDFTKNTAVRYAVYRNCLHSEGKAVELYCSYTPALQYTGEWLKQLYGESEGKDHKGIFPVSANFTTDLHSIGQFIQDGSRTLFETVLWVKNAKHELKVPHDPANVDGLNFASGVPVAEINEKAMKGTLLAHVDGGTPNLLITIDRLDDYGFGELCYFFWKSLAISGYMIGVNPFDQPGVEAYKKNMFALLGKPGYEDAKGALEERLKSLS
ncbi:MAG: glucose-6-phosphate isomerase, partial [Oscillibacter sp.]|nr:glucose-6-phosphate isomerase [Oscillibacter sp.]